MPLRVRCSYCGKTVKAGDDWAGLDGNCPSCGGSVSFPLSTPTPVSQIKANAPREFSALSLTMSSSPQSTAVPAQNPEDSIAHLPNWLWCAIAVATLCVAILVVGSVRHSAKLSELRQVQDANTQVAEMLRSASDSIDHGLLDDADSAISAAINIPLATEKADVAPLRNRLELARALRKTEELFRRPEDSLNQVQVKESTEYLIQYIHSPNSELSEKAKSLKAELESATSSDKAIESLRRMTAGEFSAFETDGKLPSFVKFSRDGLSAMFSANLRGALPQEKARRAAEKARSEAEQERIVAERKHTDAEALLRSKKREGDEFILVNANLKCNSFRTDIG